MTASSRPSADRASNGLVVVCCARADTAPLQETVDALRMEGHQVQVVPGLDEQPKALGEVIDRLAGEGLYVLCRSPRLGREMVEELRELLLARHVPFARTLTVAVGGRGALADRIRSGLRRAGTGGGASSPSPSRAPASRKSPTGPRPVVVTANPTEDEEPTLVGKRDPPKSSSPLPAPRPRPAPPKPPPAPRRPPPPAPPPKASAAPRPPVQTSIVEEIDPRVRSEDTSLSNPRISMSELDFSDLDAGDTASNAAIPTFEDATTGSSPVLITGDTVIGPIPALITGDTLTGVRLPDSLRRAAERSAPWPPAPSPSGVRDMQGEQTPSPRSTTLPATPSPPTIAPAASTSTTARGSASFTRGPLPWVLGGVAVLVLGSILAVAAWPDDESESKADNDAIASKDKESDPSPSPKSDDAHAPDDDDARPEPPTAPPATSAVMIALRSRKVRALDVLLVASELPPSGDHANAIAYCDALTIEGLAGWRLPQVGELSSLGEARMIDRGMYWSATPADTFGEFFLAWNQRRSHAQRYDKRAITVCVRGGQAGS